MRFRKLAGLAAGIMLVTGAPVHAQQQQDDATAAGIQQYREQLQEGNPAELWEARGEDLWNTARGTKNVSLEKCDLGQGPGVVKGAYAQLPKYFADAGQVMDLETRLLWCMTKLQGLAAADLTKNKFGGRGKRSDFEALAAYVTSQSRGMPMNVSLAHAKEKEAFEIGKKMFFFRGGPYDFSCATCHAERNKRIRLQDLPDLTTTIDAQRAYTTWPAYRVSQGELRTMQWRLNDCFRQQRFPELQFGSEGSIALTMFLAHNANGGIYAGPAIKR